MRFPSNELFIEGYTLRNCNFTAINSPSIRMVPDRHRLADYHNKQCWRAFQGTNIDDCERRWTPKIGGFSEIFTILGYNAYFKSELC